ncbi:MAG TPA: hypothetical protein VEI53_09010 [Ktedonobacteraceae bacterium]|nr:hypothetical protein [Ktedonobacteraceae bacterium]
MRSQKKVRKEMVPSAYLSFFITAATAGGALIGLLFVAVSIAPHRTVQLSAPVESRVIASSTFTALFNGFFISLGAVLPFWNIGVLTLIVSLIGVINSLSQGWLMLRPWPSWKNAVRRMVLTVVSLYLYVYELICAIQLLVSPAHSPLIFTLSILLMGIYSLALVRAWELLGVQRTGLLAWLNPLYEVNTRKSAGNIDQPDITLSDTE